MIRILLKSIMIFDAVAVTSIGSTIAIIPRPPNADSCVSQLYLLASALSKPIAVNCICRLLVKRSCPHSPIVMVLSKSLSAYALDMRLLYNGAMDIERIDTALSGIGKSDLKIGFMTKF